MRARTVAAIVAVAVAGFGAGVGAQTGLWSEPGDDVVAIEDADRAIAWWNGEFGAASRDPGDLATANQRIWLAIGQIVDDLMGLDLRTRQAPVVRSVNVAPTVGDGYDVVVATCLPGEAVTGGGFDVPALAAGGLPPGVAAVIPATSYPTTGGWAVRVSRVPAEDQVDWAEITVYVVCDG